MGYIKYLKKALKKPSKERLMAFRREEATVRVDHPTRINRARSLGYKAKKGVFVVRQRVPRSHKMRPARIMKGGRRSKHARRKLVLDLRLQEICERRVNKKYPNCEILNSYFVAADGKHKWYEVIVVDRASPNLKSDKQLSQITKQRGRVFRGK